MCRKPVGEGAKRTVTGIPGGWGRAAEISTIRQFVVAKHLAQAGLHQLAGGRMRQFWHDHHVVREHPPWKLAGEKRDELITIRPAAGSGATISSGLSPQRV